MFDLKGKTILVTGGGGVGVGAGVCEAITRAGGTLLLNEIDEKSACDGAARYDGAVPAPGDITGSCSIVFRSLRTFTRQHPLG